MHELGVVSSAFWPFCRLPFLALHKRSIAMENTAFMEKLVLTTGTVSVVYEFSVEQEVQFLTENA